MAPDLFCNYQLVPFTPGQVKQYLEKYVEYHRANQTSSAMTVADYHRYFDSFPISSIDAKAFMAAHHPRWLTVFNPKSPNCFSSPLAIPSISSSSSSVSVPFVAEAKQETPQTITLSALYKAFVQQWFANQAARLSASRVLDQIEKPMDVFMTFSNV